MEACPKVPMLAFELKLCNIETNDFSEKILKYILTHYQENPESFQKEINDLNQLRENAMCASKDFMGLNIIKKYYNQLQFISNRFPMKAGEPCETEFSWDDLFHEKEIAHTDIRFELECILYNVGAMHSYLGCMDKRLNDDGIKKSCTHFQFAAWAFQQVRDTYSGYAFTPDLNEDIMSFKMNLMLAQAQECVLEKSIIDNRKPSINSKISTQVIDYYKLALANNEKPEFYNSVGSRLSKDWKNYCTFKINYYSALTNYFGALSSAEQEKYGESIGYIQVCESKLAECNKMKNLFKEFQEILKYTCECIDTKSKLLKKDNDFVYNQKIISPTDLPEIKGVSLVKCLAIDFLNDPDVASQDIFIRLVSMKAHELSSMYSEEKAKLLRQINTQVDEKNAQLNQFMSALQINQLHLDNFDYLKLPKQLLECCAAISVKPALLKEDIPKSMKSIVNVSVQAKEILDEIEDIIENEEKEHREDKIKSGKMNESDSDSDSNSDTEDENITTRSKKLKEISKRYDVLLKNYTDANTSNTALHDAFNSIIKNLNLLALPLNDLSEKLPAIEPINDEESKQIRDKLVSLLAKVDEMKTQREQLLKRLQAAILDDDLTKMIASKQNDIQNASEFFNEQLKKHDQLVIYLQQNLQAQDNILRALAEANAQFASDRKKILDATQQRNAFIDSLVLSYQSVSDLTEKASKGVVFFQNLLQPLNELLKDVKDFCAKYKQERENRRKLFNFVPTQLPGQMLGQQKQLPQQPPVFNRYRPQQMPKIDQLNLNEDHMMPTNDRPKLKDFLPFMKPQTWGNNATKSNGPPTVDRSSHNIMPTGMSNNTAQASSTPQLISNINNSNIQSPINSQIPVNPMLNNQIQPPVNIPSQQFGNQSGFNNQIPTVPAMNNSDYNPLTRKPVSIPKPVLSPPQQPQQPPQMLQQQPVPVQLQFNQPQTNNYYQPQPNQIQPPLLNQQQNYIPNLTNQQQLQQQHQQQQLQQQQQQQQQQLQQKKEQEELYKIQLEQQKIYQQKLFEQQQKEKEIEAKKKELEEKERLFQMQQQQFYLQQQQQQQLQQQKIQQQQQNYLNLQQQQPIQASLIPNIPPLQASNPYLLPQQLPPVAQPSQQIQPTQVKPPELNSAELLEPFKPDSVYKPGYFKQIKLDEANLNKNLIPSQQPSSVITSPVSSQLPTNLFNQMAPITQPFQQLPQVGIPPQQPPSQLNNIFKPAQIIPNVPVNQQPTNTPIPVNQSINYNTPQAIQHKASAIDDLFDLFDGKNAPISIPALQPSKPIESSPPQPQLVTSNLDQNLNNDQIHQAQFDLNNIETKQQEKPLEQVPVMSVKSPLPLNNSSQLKLKEDSIKLPSSVSNSSINSNTSSSPITTPNTNSTKKLNFLSNPTKLDKFVNEVNKFENHVNSLTQKTLSNATVLEKEWKDLNDYQEKNINNYTISVARCYPNKNRFPDLLPYDQTRIVLHNKTGGDDYINASQIGQLDNDVPMPTFIISQAPFNSTDLFNFWSMILEQQMEVVVCLCRDSELNNGSVNSAYWPQDKQTPLNVNSIKISLISLKETPNSIQRICTVKNAIDNQSRTVIILQHVIQNNSNLLAVSTGIGLNELPENISSFLKFIKEVEYFYKTQQRSLNHPVLVHCMNGVSRSAVFILLYCVIQVIDLNCDTNQSGSLSLTDLIIRYTKQMRSKRKYMIQSMCHLKYSYEAILYYLKDILIKEGVLNKFSFNEVITSNLVNDVSSTRKQSVDSNILNDDSLISIQSSKNNETPVNISTTSPKIQQAVQVAQNGTTTTSPKTTSPISLVDLCDPNKFTLSLSDDSVKKKHKFTKNDFLNPNATKSLDSSNPNDPFRMLDPLAK